MSSLENGLRRVNPNRPIVYSADKTDTKLPFDTTGYKTRRLYQERFGSIPLHSMRSWQRQFEICADYQYRALLPTFENQHIILHCAQADGFGDVAQVFRCAEVIRKNLPHCALSVVIKCQSASHEEKVRQLFPAKNCELIFLDPQDYGGSKADRMGFQSQASCCIGIALPALGSTLYGLPTRTLLEYGFSWKVESESLKSTTDMSMGLGPLEEGINFPVHSEEETIPLLTDLQTPWVRKALLSEEKRPLYHMYVSMWERQITTLYAIAELESASENSIDVFMPLNYPLADLITWGALDPQFFIERGIGRLVCVSPEGTSCLEFGDGKTLQILNGHIPREDLKIIQQHAEEFFGCTGDGSVSEAIDLNKVPLYEIRGHKRHFAQSWADMATKNGFPLFGQFQQQLINEMKEDDVIYKKYTPKRISHWQIDPSNDLRDKDSLPRAALPDLAKSFPERALRLAKGYRTPGFVEEVKRLNTYLKEHYSVEPRLMDLVARGLALQTHPELAALEKDLLERFKEGTIDEATAVETLHSAIEALSSKRATT